MEQAQINRLQTARTALEINPLPGVLERFGEMVQLWPEKIAVEYGQRSLSYGELDRRSLEVAQAIQSKYPEEQAMVGIWLGDKLNLIATVIGALKAGAVFVPFDPAYPVKRLLTMLEEVRLDVVLTDTDNLATITEALAAEQGRTDLRTEVALLSEFVQNGTKFDTYLDINRNNDAIYIYFTSGSTGKPKGILGAYQGLSHFIDWEIKTFGLTADLRGSQLISPSFDAFLRDVFVPLCVGGTVCIPESRDVVVNGEKLMAWVQESQVQLIHCVPSLFKLLNTPSLKGNEYPALRHVLMSGERINPVMLQNWYRAMGERIQLVNLYGPSETTMVKTYYLLKAADAEKTAISIGQPMAGAEVLILDAHNQLVGEGETGEICIRTPYMTLGYYQDPALTKAKFVVNPLTQDDRDLIYRTGDLGRWQADGNLEFLGRIDHQVKIRGVRVELGEIENQLLRHPAVKEAVVVDREDQKGNTYLAAYIVAKKSAVTTLAEVEIATEVEVATEVELATEADVATEVEIATEVEVAAQVVSATEEASGKASLSGQELRAYLGQYLPEYMVPSYFVQLTALPLLGNGKIDRQALPEPDDRALVQENYVAPEGELETKLAAIWAEVLGAKQVGRLSNFFELGGHSLSGGFLAAKVHQTFQVDLPLRVIFKHPVLAELAAYIAGAEQHSYAAIEVLAEKDYYPASSVQRRLFMVKELEGESTTYNLPYMMTIEGTLDYTRFSAILQELVQRHDSFRTSFVLREGELYQQVARELKFTPVYREASLEELPQIAADFVQPFDLSKAPLLRAEIVRYEAERHLFMFDMHHIISDGTSCGIFIKELLALYAGENLPELRVQYKDFAAWQNNLYQTEQYLKQEEFWLNLFAGEIPVLHLPTDYPRPAVKSLDGETVSFALSKELSAALNQLATTNGATLFMVLLAAYNVLLQRYSGQDDIVVGTGLAGRPHADLENLVGMFVNTLAMRNQPTADKSFGEFLSEVRENSFKVYENQDYQFETLVEKLGVERDLSRNPLFDAVFVLQNFDLTAMSAADLRLTPYNFKKTTAKFDLILNAYETPEGLRFELEYSTGLFKSSTIERMTIHFIAILRATCIDQLVKIGEIELLAEAEKQQLLVDFNAVQTDFPRELTLTQLFEAEVAKTPEKVAVIYAQEQWTYRELNERANQLARVLVEKGVRREEVVGIMVDRSLNMFAGLLAILKVGGAYLPIDPGYPAARIEFMLQDSETRFLLTQKDLLQRVEHFTGERIDLSDPALYQGLETNLQLVGSANDLAYVIYTSGTTGKPKGSMTMHYNISRVVKKTNYIQIQPEDKVLQLSNYAFDGSTFDIYGAFLNGATLVVPEKDIILEAAKLAEFIAANGISIFFVTTALFNTLVDINPDCFNGVRKVLFGGERVSVQHVRKALAILGAGRIIHVYGPTETTVFATYYPVDSLLAQAENVPIGGPLANTELYVLGAGNVLQPIGVVGELCVAGEGLARGYLKRPELTAEKFVANPFKPGTKMYRTGDLARWLEDGSVEFVGRIDHQVKIRGFRIELGEIENELLKHPAVQVATVIDREDATGNKYLCAYMVMNEDLSIDDLRKYLSTELPEYMIPAYFVRLAEMPLTVNGKIDRRALPKPDGSISSGTAYVAPRNRVEEQLIQIWADMLGVDRIGVNDNFFALGGHSLRATILASRIHREFNVQIPLRAIFQQPTIAEIAEFIAKADARMFVEIPAVPVAEYYPVSSAQKRQVLLNQLDSQSLTYNVPFFWMVEGPLDLERLTSAFRTLIQRHEAFRTYFTTVNGEQVQVIRPTVEFAVGYQEVNAELAADEALLTGELRRIIKDFVQPFDLTQAPLLRVHVVKCGEKHLLMLDMHHIVTDGVSMDVLLKELVKLYDGQELAALRIQYKDFAVWQNQFLQSDQVRQQEDYWLQAFSGDIPQLTLPTDQPRPSMKSYVGAVIELPTSHDLQLRLNELALQNGATLYMVLLAAYNMLMSKYSGQEDIVVGTPMAGRPHADLEKVMGMFVNTLAIRNYPAAQKTFSEFLAEVKETVLKVTENQDYQFETLVEKLGIPRDMSRNPLFDVMLNLENANDDFAINTQELRLTPYVYDIKIAKFDLLLFVYEKAHGLHLELQYSTDLFEEATVQRMLHHYVNILEGVVSRPDVKLAEISMLSAEERELLLFKFNDNQRDYPKGKTIQQIFEERVALSPERIAVEYEGKTLTYRELNERANKLARVLRKHGVTAETVVGIMLERSLEMAVSLLAILKAGGAYLPIDPEYPKDRVMYMLKDAGARALLTKNSYIKVLSFTALQNFEANDIDLVLTLPRGHIQDFNNLPIPDRASYVDFAKYRDHIGMASVNRCISLQTTRGCPYLCIYCHKVWSKNHVYRTAESIYEEMEYFYKRGVRNFAIIDDCFNLNRENSARLFKLITQNKLKLKIFFPNGMRGDLLTEEYIDRMVEAGVVNINLSLETASPRLQKLVKKYLDIDKFKRVMDYIATEHSDVILELATMHGFPTETEEEAMMTLNFIQDIKWIHFPYIHILKVFPNTEIEELALANGVSKEDIMKSVNRAYHELPETLPFPKSFTRQYQAEFLNDYFLNKERLQKVLPVQLKLLSEEALVEKYNAYLPIEVHRIQDVLDFAGVDDLDLRKLIAAKEAESGQLKICGGAGTQVKAVEETVRAQTMPAIVTPDTEATGAQIRERAVVRETGLEVGEDACAMGGLSIFDQPAQPKREPLRGAKRFLFLDLSQHFSSESMLYKVSEQPIGLIYLMTYLQEQFGDAVDGRIYKSGVDFDSYAELKALVDEYQPDLIGIRTLTFYKEFFHQAVANLRQWGVKAPIITGGPYATSEYNTLLKDKNIDLCVIGEGEYTLHELVGAMFENGFTLPEAQVLREIKGIAFVEQRGVDQSCDILTLDMLDVALATEEATNLEPVTTDTNLAYIMYTSGTTGKPKGIMIEHRQVNNCINWMQEEFKLDETAVVVQRTNLTFDPSVWEFFWPLYLGGKVRFLTTDQGKNAEFIIDLLTENTELTMMYTTASLMTGMNYLLNAKAPKGKLRLPWFLIGAEPISMETVKSFYQYFEGRVVNTYGPTECTINNTYYYLEPDDARAVVPIGYPVANNQIYILSKALEPMPLGVAGEICIAGDSLARGYINNPTRTAEAFIDNPFGPGKLYRTGDVGRWLPDGTIEINGRVDDQVKVRGYRIELGEIESALAKHSDIHECVVVVKDTKKSSDEVKVCKKCGLTSAYPDIQISEEGICNICDNVSYYKKAAADYFKTVDDLVDLIKDANKERTSKYDCFLLFAGGRGSAYALYQLAERGINVLVGTYDNTYLGGTALQRVKRITDSLGFDHVVLTHPNTDQILKASLEVASTVCQGCFLTSSSLANDYAYQNGIKVVIGATLSRGQIIENKLFKLFRQGVTEVADVERELRSLQKVTYSMSEEITQHINVESMKDGSIFDHIKSVDFYRFCDITNAEMIKYLNEKDEYWKDRKNYAIYSTNCPIKQVGDFCHMQERGIHYYGSATSWERRLGHITLENVKEDLQCKVTAQGFNNFARRLGYKKDRSNERLETKYLCAYIVSDEEIPVAELRDFLSQDLPDYMIPSYFMTLDKLPLTSNGKVDKKALPAPTGNISLSEYVAPTNEAEEKLAAIWAEVLGSGQVGINDNFFELGGDSIKAIQILAKTNQAGINITVKDIFVHKTISKLMQNVDYTKEKELSSQDEVTGTVPLTPIQHWFFEQNLEHRHYWNQREIFALSADVDLGLLEKAFIGVIEHHDALRMGYRFVNGQVEQFNRSLAEVNFKLEHVDLSDEPVEAQQARLKEWSERLQDKLNLESDLMIRGIVFDLGANGKRLLIPIHHLVIDGISWRVLLEDLETLYNSQLNEILPFKTTSFKEWSEELQNYAKTGDLDLTYWLRIDGSRIKPVAQAQDNYWSDHREVNVELTEEETAALLTEVNWAYNTEINDTLLAALTMALTTAFNRAEVLVNLEGHGREEIIEGVDLSRTVGWFTSAYPVYFEKQDSVAETIKHVKENLRQIPDKGINFGIGRYLQGVAELQALTPEISFNYLGQYSSGKKPDQTGRLLTECKEEGGRSLHRDNQHIFLIDANGMVKDGKFQMTFSYNGKYFSEAKMQTVAALFGESLTQIIEHCLNQSDKTYTVSDFEADELDQDDFDLISELYKI